MIEAIEQLWDYAGNNSYWILPVISAIAGATLGYYFDTLRLKKKDEAQRIVSLSDLEEASQTA